MGQPVPSFNEVDQMKFRVTQPFLAFGKAPEVGDIVELTEEQAAAISEAALIAPYEIKILPKPENKSVKKQSGLSRPAQASTKKTAKRSKKAAKK
jgi:hypothetical protein